MGRTKQCKRGVAKSHAGLKNSYSPNRIDNMKNGTGYLQISTSMTKHYTSSRPLHRLDFDRQSNFSSFLDKKEMVSQPLYNTYTRHYTLVSPQHRFFTTETLNEKVKRLAKLEK